MDITLLCLSQGNSRVHLCTLVTVVFTKHNWDPVISQGIQVLLVNAVTQLELPSWLNSQGPACQCRRRRRRGFEPWVRKIPWSRKWQLAPVFLPGKFHGQRSLMGDSPSRGCKESDRAEQLSTHTQTESSGTKCRC